MLDRIFDLVKINNTITNFSEEMKKIYIKYLLNEFGVIFDITNEDKDILNTIRRLHQL
ncbi:MAG: hypothetical protein PHX04_05115 [Bacilli bacterium]|nr:hypothetical protein [Bacteroidales bacterium]MDD4188114.1 hypothetical protein [Bacilli bacterium]